MTKLSKRKLDPKDFGFYVNNLWSAFTLLATKQDIKLLFKDLFTHTEYKMFAKRLEIARRLLRGERYDDIEHDLYVTAGTVGRVSNVLTEKGDGLRKVHACLENIEAKYLAAQKERQKNLENPFRKKMRRKSLGVELIKAGAMILDKKIKQKIRQNSAKHQLEE